METFLQQSRHHGVQALLFHAVREREGWKTWPDEVRQALGAASKVGVVQELLRSHQLQKLLQDFETKGIRFLVTKGEALAKTHYAIPGTRSRCDADLFIDIKDIESARQIVLESGLAIVSPVYKTHQFTVRKTAETEDGTEIDIHWRILNSPRFARSISFAEAYAESVEVKGLAGARVLCDRHALLLACMHRMGSEWHDQQRLIWIYDIHLLASGLSPAEWSAFTSLAVDRNVQASCLAGLSLADEHFGTVLPSPAIQTLQAPEVSRKFAHSNLALLWDDWRSLPATTARLALLRELFIPPADLLMRKYQKNHRLWLPVLYIRQWFGGSLKRVSLH